MRPPIPPSLRRLSLVTLAALVTLGGCASYDSEPQIVNQPPVDIDATVAIATLDLLADADVSSDSPIIAAPFVDIDDLGRTSTFGRVLTEAFSAALVNAELTVVAVKPLSNVFGLTNNNALALSPEMQRLAAAHGARTFLIGTYAQASSAVYVHARLVRVRDQHILGATSVTVPLGPEIRVMLPTP